MFMQSEHQAKEGRRGMHLSMQMTTQAQSTWLLDSGIARIPEVGGGNTSTFFGQ